MNNGNEKPYYKEINLLRGFTIIAILLLHIGIYYSLDMGLFPSEGVFQCWGLFVAPCFFFISGLTLTINYKDRLNLKIFYRRRFQYLVPAYFIWATLIVILFNKAFNLQLFVNVLTGYSVLDMWFLFVLFQLYLLFPLVLKICQKVNRKVVFSIYFFIVSLFYVSQLLFNFSFHKWNIFAFQNEFLTINLKMVTWFFPLLIYFILGTVIGLNYEAFKEKLIKYKLLIILFWVVLFSALPFLVSFQDYLTFSIHNIWILLYSISCILFFFLIFIQRESVFFDFNGTISVGLFLVNRVIFLLALIFIPVPFGSLISRILFLLIVYLMSLFLVYLIRLLPFYKFILTDMKKFKLSYFFRQVLRIK